MKHTVYLGIDPGASGGMAFLFPTEEGGPVALPMLPTDRDIWDALRNFDPNGRGTPKFAVLEKVNGYIGVAHPGSAMFRFGESYGKLKAFLTAADIPFEEVQPAVWQRALGVPPRKRHKEGRKVIWDESKTQFKNRLKQKACQLFPKLTVTLKTCDALLISEYCRRKCEGKL